MVNTLAPKQNEQAVVLRNSRGQRLVAVWHEAEKPRAAIVMLHGWSGYRTGPHQMLTRAARTFAARRNGVLRFDFAGRGDSEGDTDETTLATMADDVRAALDWLGQRDHKRVIFLGLCSGCEVALAAAQKDTAALVLWSAPVFAAGQGDETGRRSKRAEMLQTYARKAMRPETWRKILTGRVDTSAVGRAVSGGGGEAVRNVEDGSAGHLPRGWRQSALDRFEKIEAARLLVYGTADATTEGALAWQRAHGSRFTKANTHEHLVEGANHSFYGLAWEQEVFDVTARWLDERTL
ncbi:MAG TPA: alpha/beta fold hydrolase [Abditibacteriaceae bacterium]|jgi:hypothetical protein